MIKKAIILLLSILTTFGVAAQSTEQVPLPKSLQRTHSSGRSDREHAVRFSIGGNFGFGVSNNILAINVAPHFGVLPVNCVCIGLRGTYEFTLGKDANGLSATYHIFGGGVFAEGYIWKRLILHAEYEAISFPTQEHSRHLCHGILVGPGYQQEINDHWTVYGLFLLPAYDSDNIYPIVTIRVGFNYKF